MKKDKFEFLDEEEKEIFEFMEYGNYQSVPNFEEEKKKLQEAAKNTIKLRNLENRKRNANIRLPGSLIEKLKEKAEEKGISYNSYVSGSLQNLVNS